MPALRLEAGQPALLDEPAIAAPSEPLEPVAPTASASRFRRRHFFILFSFLIMVVVPTGVTVWYLWARAVDQYVSHVGFSVRSEEQSSAIDSFLGPLDLSSSGASDADILYEFIQSQDLVARLDAKLDLRKIWSRADPRIDPIFSYHPPGLIEDLVDHWRRKVRINYDSGTGLIELEVLAFTPQDAQTIAREIYAESTKTINELSAIARADTSRYAREELAQAVDRLKQARAVLTQFRNRTQIVDPSIDVQGQMGLLTTLNQQLAEELIELDFLRKITRETDPRIARAETIVKVIEARIEKEKRKLGFGEVSGGDDAFATLVGQYESLVVDREFAEQTYTAALAAFDAAQAEARRQTRYLAAHVRPTLAEKSQYPQRVTLLALILLFSFLTWAMTVLVIYSLRDRH